MCQLVPSRPVQPFHSSILRGVYERHEFSGEYMEKNNLETGNSPRIMNSSRSVLLPFRIRHRALTPYSLEVPPSSVLCHRPTTCDSPLPLFTVVSFLPLTNLKAHDASGPIISKPILSTELHLLFHTCAPHLTYTTQPPPIIEKGDLSLLCVCHWAPWARGTHS